MNPATLARTALFAAALAASVAGPAAAESWAAPGTGPTFVPVGVAPAPAAPQVDRRDRPIIVTDGPIIILPGHKVPRYPVVRGHADRDLPLRCLKSYSVNTGTWRLFEAACLQEQGVNLRQLPTRCAVSIRTTRDVLRGYDPSCLRDAGYRMAGD